jgi:hypothetical protein
LLVGPVLIYEAALNFIDKYLGIVPPQLRTVTQQVSNYVCQSLLPQVGQADKAYLSDMIDQGEWECWVRAAGAHVAEAQKVRDANRDRPNFQQANKLHNRQFIGDDRYAKLLRAAGVLNADDQTDLQNADNHWPSVGEQTRWAGEQLFDPDTVDRFELDSGFDALWMTRFKELADGSQLSQEFARYQWWAHWRRPGVGQLIEMARRLRPDVAPANTAFTQDDLDAALKQEGYNDYWARRIKAISFRVAQRRDVQRLYQYHQVDEDGMKRLLLDQGYESDFADQLVESWKAQRKQTELTYNGSFKAAALIRDYAAGLLARSELESQIEEIVYYDGQDEEILSNALAARELAERKLSVAGLKSAFMKGLVRIEDAQAQLASLGMDADAISEITQYWLRVVKSKPKQVPAATLCQWRKDGLINGAEQAAALSNLGYTAVDVKYIVEDCTLKIQQANAKAEAKALAAAQKAAEAAAKSAEKAAVNARRRVRIATAPSTNGTLTPAAGP